MLGGDYNEAQAEEVRSQKRGPPLLWSTSFRPRDGAIKFVRAHRRGGHCYAVDDQTAAFVLFAGAHAGVIVVT